MSGQNQSIIENGWIVFKESIDRYIANIGINKLRYNEDVDHLLSISREELFGMSAQTLGENAFLLAQYAACIQKEINDHYVKSTWAEHNLSIRLGQVASNYGTQYTPYEERKNMAKSDDTVARELSRMILMSNAYIKQLDFLSSRINAMYKAMSDLQYTKRRDRYE